MEEIQLRETEEYRAGIGASDPSLPDSARLVRFSRGSRSDARTYCPFLSQMGPARGLLRSTTSFHPDVELCSRHVRRDQTWQTPVAECS